jgi:hypothetical protein
MPVSFQYPCLISPLRIWPLAAAGHYTAGRNRTTADLPESLPSAR